MVPSAALRVYWVKHAGKVCDAEFVFMFVPVLVVVWKQPSTLRELIHSLVLLCKLCWMEWNEHHYSQLLDFFDIFASNASGISNHDACQLAVKLTLSLHLSLLQELNYSSSRSHPYSNRLTSEYHLQCHNSYQSLLLLRSFRTAISICSMMLSSSALCSTQMMKSVLTLLLETMSWNHRPNVASVRSLGRSSSGDNEDEEDEEVARTSCTSFEWRQVLVEDPQVPQLLFRMVQLGVKDPMCINLLGRVVCVLLSVLSNHALLPTEEQDTRALLLTSLMEQIVAWMNRCVRPEFGFWGDYCLADWRVCTKRSKYKPEQLSLSLVIKSLCINMALADFANPINYGALQSFIEHLVLFVQSVYSNVADGDDDDSAWFNEVLTNCIGAWLSVLAKGESLTLLANGVASLWLTNQLLQWRHWIRPSLLPSSLILPLPFTVASSS